MRDLRNLCLIGVMTELHPRKLGEASLQKVLPHIPGVQLLGIYSDSDEAVEALSRATCRGLIILVLSGGTEELIVDLVEAGGKPTLLIGSEEYNSLAAMIEAYSYLASIGVHQVYPLAIDVSRILESEQRELLARTISPLHAIVKLQGARIGLIGGVSRWLVYSGRQVIDAKKRLHSDIIEISTQILFDYYESIEVDDVEVNRLASVAVQDLEQEGLRKVIGIYKALRKIVDEYKLDAVTMSCFYIARELGATPCYAVSRLNSEGVDAGCEGDIPALTTMMLLRRITGEPGFMANVAGISRNTVTLAHCSAPLRLASSYMLMPHFETGFPAGVSARLPEGRQVTIAKIDYLGNKIVAFKGRIKASGLLNPKQCRTQVVVETGFDAYKLIESRAGNHMVLAIGDWLLQIKTMATLLNMRAEILE